MLKAFVEDSFSNNTLIHLLIKTSKKEAKTSCKIIITSLIITTTIIINITIICSPSTVIAGIATTAKNNLDSHIVAVFEGVLELGAHFVVVHCHEKGVDDDAQGDEEVDEGVHDEELDDPGKPVPAGAALPAEEQLVALCLEEFLFALALLHAQEVWFKAGFELEAIVLTSKDDGNI